MEREELAPALRPTTHVKAPASWAHSIRFAQWCDWAGSKESLVVALFFFGQGRSRSLLRTECSSVALIP